MDDINDKQKSIVIRSLSQMLQTVEHSFYKKIEEKKRQEKLNKIISSTSEVFKKAKE